MRSSPPSHNPRLPRHDQPKPSHKGGSAPNPPLLAAGAIGGNFIDPAYGRSTKKNRSGLTFSLHDYMPGIWNKFRCPFQHFLKIIRLQKNAEADISQQPSLTAQQRKENLNEMVESAFRATTGNGDFIPEGSKLFEIPLL